MEEIQYRHSARIVSRLRRQAKADEIRVTIHGHREMAAENITYDSVREALMDGEILENYPDHQRGPCCLLCGRIRPGDFLHVVCTTSLDVIVVITVYKPKRPKWITPFERGGFDEM
uniref:DUF4258 domain-containing protein n=2 Tax=unclassified Candidatus Kentrum TaxID=2643149 RepID=A0A450TE68_9GAMM|nr:MAG: protein of unknown function (DUF4258) [Candidatus Kentron sp. FM]VFJ71986.1 MAG: protein of unknown function (DUF4258) [Candidatus Kentron sp. FM]VFK19073.1 MAG: protein of unknown function (DUF4258) [Candidatus Kentron sp. FM]VFK54128.1 MAG: protein of unknown function (DUF4258) [Candidatus Kentron sp. TC]